MITQAEPLSGLFLGKHIMELKPTVSAISVGQTVPDFKMDAYLPTEGQFGKVDSKELRKHRP